MKTTWQQLTIKILFWLIVEVALNILGIDQLADYGEFIASKKISAIVVLFD
ncbi:hypothetical protein [Merismopedia glauca]|uniref:hypothetical protein n=1 Tax=Merismopedia glauca TaxID=292586 RepID=UPI0015E7E2F6|nr:hypothetical protein [Merismopedia glauca]